MKGVYRDSRGDQSGVEGTDRKRMKVAGSEEGLDVYVEAEQKPIYQWF